MGTNKLSKPTCKDELAYYRKYYITSNQFLHKDKDNQVLCG